MKALVSSVFLVTTVCGLWLAPHMAYGQTSGKTKLVYHDADVISVDKSTGQITAEGDVLFLLGDIFVHAEKIIYDQKNELMTAEGNVKIFRGKEQILGSQLVVDNRTREMRMENIRIIADPLSNNENFNEKVLGFSRAELEFETSRSARATEINRELRSLRESYIAQRNLKRVKRNEASKEDAEIEKIIRRYSQLLERLARTQFQPNATLSNLSQEERHRLEQRRQAAKDYAQKQLSQASKVTGGMSQVPGYVVIKADRLYQNAQGNYEVTGVSMTPCRCDEEDLPVWGFSARSGLVEPGDYVTLRGATVDVANTPVIYSPWLKFPIKTQRESGLLLASFYASRGGEAFSQPLYLTLGDSADTTLTFNDFTNRGQRYDAEVRWQVMPESRLRLAGQYIKDRKYQDDYQLKKQALDEKIAKEQIKDPAKVKTMREQLGQDRSYRWGSQGSWNVPITASGAVKADAEFVSDNRFLGDFSEETEALLDIFAAKPSSRRFLTQEAAAEYYGNNVTLSLRAQGVRDVFALRNADTPVRLPRVEFTLLPKRFFDLPVAFDQILQWERVHRVGGTPFVDMTPSSTPGNFPFPGVGTATSQSKNERKDPDEPYAEGDRSHSVSRLSLPLPANDFVNASVSTQAIATQYRFPAVFPYSNLSPYQTYVKYEATANVPMYSVLNLAQGQNVTLGTMRHDFTPSATFTYIPAVERSREFPTSYRLFYEVDNVVATQEVELAWTSLFAFSRESYVHVDNEIPRLSPDRDIGVANNHVFQEVLDERGLNIEKTPDAIFAFSSGTQSPEVFQAWAVKELGAYETEIMASEFGHNFVWPGPTAFRRSPQWHASFLKLEFKTKYNFAHERTAREANKLRLPNDPVITAEPWGDLSANATWTVSPIAPVSGSLGGTWNQEWNKFKDAHAGVSAGPVWGLSASFLNAYTVKDVDAGEPLKLRMERTIETGYAYEPFKWLRFTYQKKLLLNQVARENAAANDTFIDPEFEYKAAQTVQFLGIQDCMDITLSRFKDFAYRERFATYAIGINMKFMGESRSLPNIGTPLDKAIKERNERYEPK